MSGYLLKVSAAEQELEFRQKSKLYMDWPNGPPSADADAHVRPVEKTAELLQACWATSIKLDVQHTKFAENLQLDLQQLQQDKKDF